jgi:ribosomal subunit interface protein
MDIRIKTTDYEMTSETKTYLDERIAHLEKLLGSDAAEARCEVELGRAAGKPRHGANIWFAEIHIISPGGKRVVATNNSESINGAIDDVKVEVERQIKRGRQLHVRLARKSGAALKRFLKLDSGDL